ncbi:lipoprotein antigen [Bowdeniella nasicola]|uniref:Lipoprotein antigen n=1 Tax=Bowdeniella nasicola TaxID=208480 RepID=A0A1H4AAB8_9ACTO|nr:lipoprotein [Bowdeniella nasicola]SEA33083.1 lipoprotein antigen [Bowdeniella nasicola]
MKHKAVLAAVAVLLLTGCSQGSTADEPPYASPNTTTPAPPSPESEAGSKLIVDGEEQQVASLKCATQNGKTSLAVHASGPNAQSLVVALQDEAVDSVIFADNDGTTYT